MAIYLNRDADFLEDLMKREAEKERVRISAIKLFRSELPRKVNHNMKTFRRKMELRTPILVGIVSD